MECIICANFIDNEARICSAVVCNHNNICSICYVRIRALQKNYNCVICKRELEFVVCFTIDDKKGNGDGSVGSNTSQLMYSDFEVWDNKLVGHDSILDNNCQMFFPTKYYKSIIQKLWSYQCTICFKIYRDMRGLKSHVSADHHMQICGLCVDNKHAFPSEQRLYSAKEYEQHLKSGDNDGSLGHPNCEFCRKRYYDSSALFIHLNKDHFGCHICERNNIKFKYFKDYNHLETHFRKDHFLCEESCCLEKKFVVFENKIDIELHNRQHHPSLQSKRNTTLKLDFKLSRSATAKTDEVVLKEDGSHEGGGGGEHYTRYEGGMGGRVCDGEWQVELQYATTDPREALRALANAAASSSDEYYIQPVNTPLVVTMEEFPSLLGDSSVAASTGPITVGSKWMSVGGSGGGLSSSKQRSKKTDFPDLPKSSDMVKSALYSVPGTGGHQRTAAAATSSGKSYMSTIEKEYESMGSRSSSTSGGRKGGPDNNNNTQNNQLKMFESSISGSWGARVSVKPQKAPKSSSSSKAEDPRMSYQPTSDGGDLDYLSESRHSAPTHSLKAAEQSPSSSIVNHSVVVPPTSSTDDYPQLAASHATTAPPTLSNVKKMINSKPIAKAGGWEDALLSVGISSKAANKKVVKSKLSVVKLTKSNSGVPAASSDSSLDLTSAKLIGKLSNDLSEWEDAGGSTYRKGTTANSSSAVKPKVKTENLFTLGNMKLSSSADPSSDASSRPVSGTSRSSVPPVAAAIEESVSKTTALKTYGSWVTIGGAGK